MHADIDAMDSLRRVLETRSQRATRIADGIDGLAADAERSLVDARVAYGIGIIEDVVSEARALAWHSGTIMDQSNGIADAIDQTLLADGGLLSVSEEARATIEARFGAELAPVDRGVISWWRNTDFYSLTAAVADGGRASLTLTLAKDVAGYHLLRTLGAGVGVPSASLTVSQGVSNADFADDLLGVGHSEGGSANVPLPFAGVGGDVGTSSNGKTWSLSAGGGIGTRGSEFHIESQYTRKVADFPEDDPPSEEELREMVEEEAAKFDR